MELIQPIDTGVLTFFLHFEDYEIIQIDEPYGFRDLDIGLKQKDDGHARDIVFEITSLKFEKRPFAFQSVFERLLIEYNRKYNNALVELEVVVDGSSFYKVFLDFATIQTDDNNFVEISPKEKTSDNIFEDFNDLKIDLNSRESRNGITINNAPHYNVDLTSEVLPLEDVWEFGATQIMNGSPAYPFCYDLNLYNDPNIDNPTAYVNNVTTGNIPNLYKFIRSEDAQAGITQFNRYAFEIKDGNAYFSVVLKDFNATYSNSLATNGISTFVIRYETYDQVNDFNFANLISSGIIATFSQLGNSINIDNYTSVFFHLPPRTIITCELSNTEENNVSANNHQWEVERGSNMTVQSIEHTAVLNNGTYEITETNVTVPTKGVRLFDMGNYLVNHISDNEYSFVCPTLQEEDKYRNVFVFNDHLLKGVTQLSLTPTQPFITTWKDYVGTMMSAFNLDWHIKDKVVYMFSYKDNYSIKQSLELPFNPFNESVLITHNEKFIHNQFKYGYKKYYQDDSKLKEKSQSEATFTLTDAIDIEEEKIDIPYIADANIISEILRNYINDDNISRGSETDIYMIDCVKHSELPNLYVNRTSEGFSSVSEPFLRTSGINLRLTVKRLLLSNFKDYLAVFNYIGNTVFKQIEYIGNEDLATETTDVLFDYDGVIVEGNHIYSFELGDPIITMKVYEFEYIKMKYTTFVNTMLDIQANGSFITIKQDNVLINLYILEFKYDWSSETVSIKGELKI